MFRLKLRKLKDGAGSENKGNQDGARRDDADGRLGHALAEESINDEPGSREQRNQPDEIEKIHCSSYHFIRSISLMFIVSLFLNIAMTIPSPTAASAAATVMTKMAKT